MKRRSLLGSLGATICVSVSGCLNSGGDDGDDGGDGDGDTPPWLRRIEMEADREEQNAKLVAHVKQNAGVSEVSLHGPKGNLVTTVVVGEDQRRVRLAEVDVQTISPYFYGLAPGTYEISALRNGKDTEREPFDLVPDLTVENVTLIYATEAGKEWVAGFRTSLGNRGMYPFVFKQFGAIDGVPSPPADGEAPAGKPTNEDDDVIVWGGDTQGFREGRDDEAGSLVRPASEGTPDQDVVDDLSGEHTATLEYTTTEETATVEVDYRLEGDLVDTGEGYAMSGGEVLEVRGEVASVGDG
jgi:hypothetical protein